MASFVSSSKGFTSMQSRCTLEPAVAKSSVAASSMQLLVPGTKQRET